jgi:hypothetical protein
MMIIQRGLMVGVLWFCLAGLPSSLLAQSPPEKSCHEVVTLLKEQNSNLSRDLRRIHREIAALRADFDRPSIKDVFGGIGYIFGLFGVAAFVAARRKE